MMNNILDNEIRKTFFDLVEHFAKDEFSAAIYYPKKKEMVLCSNSWLLDGFSGNTIENVPETFIEKGFIYERDLDSFLKIFGEMEEKKEYGQIYLSLRGKKLPWQNYSLSFKKMEEKELSYLLILKDCSELRIAQDKYSLYREITIDKSVLTLETNLDLGIAHIDFSDKYAGKYSFPDETNYGEFVEFILSNVIDEKEKKNLKTFLNKNFLFRNYEKGKRRLTMVLSSFAAFEEKKKYNVIIQLGKNGHDNLCMILVFMDVSPLYSKIEHLSYIADRDSLTKIFNRHSFENKTKRFFEDGNKHYLIVLDIDNFKEINDKYGHLMGDDALIEVAKTLKKAVRSNDCIARYGGDEFLILVDEFVDKDVLEEYIVKVQNQLIQTSKIKFPFEMTISCGIAVFGDTPENYLSVFSKADKALYLAKGLGKNNISFYRDL